MFFRGYDLPRVVKCLLPQVIDCFVEVVNVTTI